MSENVIPPDLLKQLAELQKRLESVETDVKTVKDLNDIGKDIAKEVQDEVELLKQHGVTIPYLDKKVQKLKVRGKRGRGAKPITRDEILDVQKISKSARECARKMGVDYRTYKKYARMHGVHKMMAYPPPKGLRPCANVRSPHTGKYKIEDIIQNKWPDFPIHRLKDKLIRSGKKESICEQCGFKERRLTDGKIPLLLAFEDGNKKNHQVENLRVLCYNCAFLTGRCYVKKGEKSFDPDVLQDSKKILPARH